MPGSRRVVLSQRPVVAEPSTDQPLGQIESERLLDLALGAGLSQLF